MDTPRHLPVLLTEVLAALPARSSALYLDATVGLGGPAEALLARDDGSTLIGLDLDFQALAQAGTRLMPFQGRVTLIRCSYRQLQEVLDGHGCAPLAGALFDLGVSSLHLDDPTRGLPFRCQGPLDMRCDREGPTAAEWLAGVSEEDLVRVLREFGEESRSRRVARSIVWARERWPILTTTDLRRIVHQSLGCARGRIDSATRTFQAVRIAVNHELEGIAPALETAARHLGRGGRLAVISFHSLEDRIVKQTMRRLAGRCICPPGTGVCACHPESLLDIVTRRPIVASDQEVAANPRARSAKLRVAERR